MKNTVKVLAITLLGAALVACESMKLGDAGLSPAPETSGATVDTLFASIKDADKVLLEAYYYLPYGIVTSLDNKMGSDFLESITDHFVSNKNTEGDGPIELYYNGGLSANMSGDGVGGETHRFGSEINYKCIRYGWLFLENADRIPNADPALLAQRKAEAKMCIAIAYADMFRFVGGVPLLDHAVKTDEEMKYPRNTFAETVDFIVKLCDEAAPDLPWKVSTAEDGRLTRAAALGLKLRILCYAASPTFNSNTLWRSDANEYTCYTNYDAARWQAAKDAADEFMKANISYGGYTLEQAQPDAITGHVTPRAYRLAYRKGYFNRGSSECIISVRKNNEGSFHNKHIDVQDDFGCGATLDWVNKFTWANGDPFPEDFDWENKANWPEQPFFKQVADTDPDGTLVVDKIHFAETRDPRLYENVCVPGDIWRNGNQGPAFDNAKGHGDGCPGFLMMKYVLQTDNDRSIPPHWCLMRYAEVLLNAAEAYNEADGGPSDKAYTYVNAVRARVGLPGLPEGLSQEEFRKALILERELEFGFEEVRWFDMVRWGLTEAFTTPLHGLTSFGNKDRDATVFTYGNAAKSMPAVKDAYPPRKWYTDWDTKWYFAPIPALEINKDYGMTQNPGW